MKNCFQEETGGMKWDEKVKSFEICKFLFPTLFISNTLTL